MIESDLLALADAVETLFFLLALSLVAIEGIKIVPIAVSWALIQIYEVLGYSQDDESRWWRN